MQIDFSGVILVTGASGKTGQAVVRELAQRGGRVRAFVRRDDAARDLLSAGAAEAQVGDLLDAAALRRAIAGSAQVIHICPPMHPQEEELGKRVIELSEAESVGRLTLYSVLHPVVDVPHHRRKLGVEKALIESSLVYTILQPGRYMQHLATAWKDVVEAGVHSMPFAVDRRFSLVDLHDLAEAAARVMLVEGHEYATYQLCGPERLSQIDCASILSNHLGREVRAAVKPMAAAAAAFERAGMPAARIENMRIMNAHYDAHGFVGAPTALRMLLGREPTSFARYVARDFPR